MCAADDEVVRRLETETPRQFKNVVNMKNLRNVGIMSSFRTSFDYCDINEINRFPRQLKNNIATEHKMQAETSL